MDEGVVERGEDTGHTENELACMRMSLLATKTCRDGGGQHLGIRELTFAGLGAEGDVLLGSAGGLLGSHVDN